MYRKEKTPVKPGLVRLILIFKGVNREFGKNESRMAISDQLQHSFRGRLPTFIQAFQITSMQAGVRHTQLTLCKQADHPIGPVSVKFFRRLIDRSGHLWTEGWIMGDRIAVKNDPLLGYTNQSAIMQTKPRRRPPHPSGGQTFHDRTIIGIAIVAHQKN